MVERSITEPRVAGSAFTRAASALRVRSRGRTTAALSRLAGSSRFLLWQTAFIAVWVAYNVVVEHRYTTSHPGCLRVAHGLAHYSAQPRCAGGFRAFDPYPFTLLLLVLSVQAAFAAPLVLIGQNISIARDRGSASDDVAQRGVQRETLRYVMAEVHSIRVALDDAMSRRDVSELSRDQHE